jgi:hypothetical protein
MDKVTRNRLRSMMPGDSFSVTCSDGGDLESQRNTAYQFGKVINSKFSCRTEGLILTVTRL